MEKQLKKADEAGLTIRIEPSAAYIYTTGYEVFLSESFNGKESKTQVLHDLVDKALQTLENQQ